MAKTNNSLTTILGDVLRVQQNGLEVLNSISDIVASKRETVTIDITDENGAIKQIQVPSFGNIKSEIKRLDNNVKQISNLGEGSAALQLQDGSFREIVASSLKKEAEDIENIRAPSTFSTQNNHFFESFLNPLMYIDFDFSDQIKANTERVEIDRFILDLDTTEKRELFEQKWNGSSEISRDQFINDVNDNNIEFFRDNQLVDLPPQDPRFYGGFSVLEIINETEESEQDGETVTERVFKAKLNKLTYSDNNSDLEDTVELKQNDSLLVNKNGFDTRYIIENIDTGKNIVKLRRVEGFDSFGVGANILSIYKPDAVPTNVNVNVGFNERTVLFIKPIDPQSKQPAKNWSPGVGFYTNELQIENGDGEQVTLATYYKNNVVDFGEMIFEKAKENIPSSTVGIEPDPPEPDSNDFRVVQINEHLTQSAIVKEIKDLNSSKIKISNELDELKKEIREKRQKIQSTDFSSQVVEESERNELRELINERNSKSEEYRSIINEINTKASEEALGKIEPKFRVKGFWPFPEPKESEFTDPQQVIQFKIRYRYLNKNGGGNDPQQITFTDQDGTEENGTVPTWEETVTQKRARRKNPETGNFEWVTEDVQNSDRINANQLNLPISKNEIIEFQVKSLSEAGYPQNPQESIWSDTIRVEFPDDLTAEFEVSDIIEEAQRESVRVRFQTELDQLGVPQHLDGMSTINGKTYHHNADDIHSGFITQEQNPITLFDKLRTMDEKIRELEARIEDAKGKMTVKIIDDEGNETVVEKNSTVKKFAGNYKDIVKDLNIKKGVIVSKTYFIKIQNDAASDLELYSRVPGSVEELVKASYKNANDFEANDLQYNQNLRYDAVPMALTNPGADEKGATFNFDLPRQSGQAKSQFIYSRYKNVELVNELYTDVDTQTGALNLPTGGTVVNNEDIEYRFQYSVTTAWTGSTNASEDFIWDGANLISGTQGLVDTDSVDFSADQIEVHENHPLISDFVNNNEDPNSYIRNSRYANKVESDTQDFEGLKQAAFFVDTTINPNKSLKMGFREDDQYLLGPNSVGSYLFLAPQSHKNIKVNGADALSAKTIGFGPSNAISIPVIFQYRMTDYWGKGDAGIGNIGGDPSGSTDQLIYSKKIGIDINQDDNEKFSFDLKVTGRYKSTSLDAQDIPQRTFAQAIDDLNSPNSQNQGANIS